jgi:putative PIN family toxin of toxin-antitoxin system
LIPVVLDTNVLVSGLINKEGVPGKILSLILQREIILCLDRRIIDEYRRVIPRHELKINKEESDWVLDFILDQSLLVEPEPMRVDIPDPDDLMFIEVAIKAKTIIVTGNKRHFPAHAINKNRVLSPVEFMEMIAK